MAASFDVSKDDAVLIGKIVDRAKKKFGRRINGLSLHMDITACHASGNPLDLERMLGADDSNFYHDIFGVERHLDRETGQLKDCFSPRFSKRDVMS